MTTLWLICDASGSMVEGGKRLIVRGLVREVEQYIRLGYGAVTEIKLVVWKTDAKSIAWSPGDEVPLDLFDCKNSVDANPLAALIGNPSADRLLILTDGFWSDESRAAIKLWNEKLGKNALRIIKVGSDANPRLKGTETFEAEEFFAAMDGWFEK